MPVSKKIAQLPASATMAMTQLARDLRAQGKDVISLSVGEPDFDTPDYVKQAAYQAIEIGKTKYTAVDGIVELKQAVVQKFNRENGLEYGLDQINISPGGKAVIFNALMASLEPGDEVVILAPCWVSYPDMVTLLGGKPVILGATSKRGFKITANQLADAISERTKWLILNSPSNPTGAVYTREELIALGDVLRDHPDVMTLSDEIYEHLTYDGAFTSFAKACPDLYDRTVTMNGVSKAYAMTGWRIGYAGGPRDLIKAMGKIMGQTTSNPSSISQWASVAALNGDQSFLTDRRETFTARRDYVLDRLKRIPGLSCAKPGGAFYVFIDVQDWLGGQVRFASDTELCLAILEEALVALVPGSAFHAPGHFRLSYATDFKSLEQAMDRLETFFVS